ncbi:hypothetical protein PR001_g25717 [Phytophthora rubi]|uniref:Uncharacterized protein n=2 Tax=Phytophthora rubi TaxID=129364 RepID=A0A6A3HXK5_9STRA|nr:hypothetical protein PR001_g25717 [Phytophthora rubi]
MTFVAPPLSRADDRAPVSDARRFADNPLYVSEPDSPASSALSRGHGQNVALVELPAAARRLVEFVHAASAAQYSQVPSDVHNPDREDADRRSSNSGVDMDSGRDMGSGRPLPYISPTARTPTATAAGRMRIMIDEGNEYGGLELGQGRLDAEPQALGEPTKDGKHPEVETTATLLLLLISFVVAALALPMFLLFDSLYRHINRINFFT